MRLYYFVHATGQDPGNSGIPRVTRNLGAALQGRPEIELLPVRWCSQRRAIVHAEYDLLENLRLFGGPTFAPDDREGLPIDFDRPDGSQSDPPWVLIPEAPHLGSWDRAHLPVHLSFVLGYVRQHGFRSAVIFHDILPLSHFGRDTSREPEALSFVIYANALASADVVFPVSEASGGELLNWFARNAIQPSSERYLRPVLLPEEMVGFQRGMLAHFPQSQAPVEFGMWGSVYPHKNQSSVLEAFNGLCARRPNLDLRIHLFGSAAGREASRVARAMRRSNGRIRVHGFVDDATMLATVARCRASIFLSLAEGYGLPVAESLWLGKPCLTSSIPPMTEIAAGGGCFLADPTNQESIASAIEQVATDDALLNRLSQELAARPVKTWVAYAGELIGHLSSARNPELGKQYFEKMFTRPPIPVESFDLAPSQLTFNESYTGAGGGLLKDKALQYSRAIHGKAIKGNLCWGPYIDIKQGTYSVLIDGDLRGDLLVRITTSGGSVLVGEWHMRDDLTPMKFDVPKSSAKFEIVLSPQAETESLSMNRITIERFL